MEGTPLFPLPEGMLIDQIQVTKSGLLISVSATHPTSCCPLCACASSSIKGHYRRSLRDVRCGGRPVPLALTVRKFYCRNALCERKVCTERLAVDVSLCVRVTIRHGERITLIVLGT